MAGQERLDSIIDNAALLKEINTLNDNLKTVLTTLNNIKSAGDRINFSGSLTEAGQAAAEATRQIQQLKKERQELLNQEQRIKTAAQQAAAAAAAQAAQQRAETQAQLDASRTQQAAAQAALAQLRLQNAERRRSRQGIDAEAGSLNQLRGFLRQAIASFDAMGEAERNSVRGRALLSYIQDLNREVLALEVSTGRNQRNVGNYTESIKKAFGGLQGLAGQLGLAMGAGEIAKKIFDTTREVNGLNAALHAASGTEEEFLYNQEFLRTNSDRLGISIAETTKTFTSFYTAATKSGLAAKDARFIFNSAAEASSTLHLSQEDTNGVLLAFSQILGKGKVQAEELRGQIGERIPGAFAIAAKSIGVTQQELDKMLQKGEIIASDFLPKFAAGLKEAFGQENRVETLNASIERLSNAWTNMINDNSSGLSRFFGMIVDLATEALESIDNLTAGISYVMLKATNSKLAYEFINTRAVKDIKEQIKTDDINDLLTAVSNTTKNINIYKNQLSGLKKVQDELASPAYAEAYKKQGITLESTAKQIEEVEARLDLARKANAARTNEIDSRLPGGRDLNADTAVTKAPTKAELDAASRMRKLESQAAFEDMKADLQIRMDNDKAIYENEKETYFKRITALNDFREAKKKLNALDAENEKRKTEEDIGRGKATSIKLGTIEKQLKQEQNKADIEFAKAAEKIEDDSAKRSTDKATKRFKDAQDANDKLMNAELETNERLFNEGRLQKEQYEVEKLRIANKYALQNIDLEISTAKEILQIQEGLGIDVTAQRQKIADLEAKRKQLDIKGMEDLDKYRQAQAKAEYDAALAAYKKREELRKREIEGIKQLAAASTDALFSLFDSYYDGQKAAVSQQLEDLDKTTNAQVEAVNKSTASEEQKAEQIAVINARAATQKAALDRKQKAIDNEKAKFDKAKAIADIIQNTAVAITKVIPNPILIALAAATGAVQLATVLAQPIPQYRYGTDNHPGGLMMVNDGGKLEPMVSPDGTVSMSTKKNHILSADAGTMVFPSIADFINEYAGSLMGHLGIPAPDNRSGGSQVSMDTSSLEKAILKGRVSINISNTWGGIETSMRKGATITKFVGKQIKFGA